MTPPRLPSENVERAITAARRGARAGALVLRWLVSPPAAEAGKSDPDAAWNLDNPESRPDPRQLLERGANVTRRGLGLVTLLALSGLGALLLLLMMILLGISLANGHVWAGILLFLTVLVALVAAWWVFGRASELLGTARTTTPAAEAVSDDESRLLEFWQANRAAVPQALLPAFQSTVLAVRDALRAAGRDESGGTFTLSRDLYDARQAAREDLPELFAAYRAVPPTAQSDLQLLDHLRTIEGRMRQILDRQREVQARDLSAQGAYLRDKYDPASRQSDTAGSEPEPVDPLPEPERVPVGTRRR